MSHSTVLVVVRNADDVTEAEALVEDALAPFDENISVPEYPRWEDEETVERAMKFAHQAYLTEVGPRPDGEDPEALSEWTRQAVGLYSGGDADRGVREGEKFGVLTTYNPKSKWDWFVLGGRWRGFFQIKEAVTTGYTPEHDSAFPRHDAAAAQVAQVAEGTRAVVGGQPSYGDEEGTNYEGRADLARKGDIDFEAMRALAGVQADAQYDEFEKVTAGLEVPPTWEETRAKHGAVDHEAEGFSDRIQAAREEFSGFPWVKALTQARLNPFFGDAHEHWKVGLGGRDAFVAEAVAGVGTTFAVLLDGEWYERGQMGWWGMVTDEKDGDDWNRQWTALVDGLPDDAWLAVCDVHI